jgi:hypothetical protein
VEVDDLAVFEFLLVAVDAPQGVRPIHGGGVNQRAAVPFQQTRFDFRVGGANVERSNDPAVGVDLVGARADGDTVEVGVEEGDLVREAIRVGDCEITDLVGHPGFRASHVPLTSIAHGSTRMLR